LLRRRRWKPLAVVEMKRYGRPASDHESSAAPLICIEAITACAGIGPPMIFGRCAHQSIHHIQYLIAQAGLTQRANARRRGKRAKKAPGRLQCHSTTAALSIHLCCPIIASMPPAVPLQRGRTAACGVPQVASISTFLSWISAWSLLFPTCVPGIPAMDRVHYIVRQT